MAGFPVLTQQGKYMRKKPFVHLLAFGLSVCVFLALPSTLMAQADYDDTKDKYVDEVVKVLRTQVSAMRILIRHEIKYSDNMVRHASAIDRAFGMLGPMEWHTAEAVKLMRESDAQDKLTEQEFEELAKKSLDAIDRLSRSAERYLRDRDQKLMLGAINTVIKSCGACHNHLPEGSVPQVWEGMKEQGLMSLRQSD